MANLFQSQVVLEVTLLVYKIVLDFLISFPHEFFEDLLSKLWEEEVHIREQYLLILVKEERHISLNFLLHEVVVGSRVRVQYFFLGLLLPTTVQMTSLREIYFIRRFIAKV